MDNAQAAVSCLKTMEDPKTRVANLKKLGISHKNAMLCGNARKKYWHMSKIKWVAIAMPERFFTDRGFCFPGYFLISRTALVRDPYAGWCGRAPQ